MRVNEATIGQRRLELAAQLAHVDVDGAVSRPQVTAPDGPVELLSGYDRAESLGHRDEQFELAHGQRQRTSGRQDEALLQSNLQLASVEDLWDVRALGDGRHNA